MIKSSIAKTTYVKFAVVGLVGAGTTSFIQTVAEINEMENWGRLTIGHLTNEHIQVKLGLLPKAQDQWEIVLADKIGIVVLVDSTRPDQLPEIKALMQAVRRYSSAPFIVLANKQDQPGALSADTIRHRLSAGLDVPVMPCVAKDKASITRVLHELTDWAQVKK